VALTEQRRSIIGSPGRDRGMWGCCETEFREKLVPKRSLGTSTEYFVGFSAIDLT